MIRQLTFLLALFLGAPAWGVIERRIDFGAFPAGQTPPGFRSAASGTGQPGDWKIILDETTAPFEPLSPKAPPARKPVLAQLSRNTTDEHYPVLILDDEIFSDFTVTTRFKTVEGDVARMAGIAFRIQDENNYYVVRASSMGNTFRFYKFVDGQRSPAIGPNLDIPSGQWHELTVHCRGNQIRCLLNGQEVIPPLTDNSFASGKVGFWTKSDSVSYFADPMISYTPREILAQRLVSQVIQDQPRLIGLRIVAAENPEAAPAIIASGRKEDLGTAAGDTAREVIRTGIPYYTRGTESVTVTLPLTDRNGEPVGAVAVELRRIIGQTEQNALARARPIAQRIGSQIQSRKDLWR